MESGDGLVGLVEAARLLLSRGGDLRHDVARLFDGADNTRPGLSRLPHQPGAMLHLGDAVLDEALDLFRGSRAARGEGTDLLRYDREAATLLAGARRFDGGVQGQEVGLERDLV